MPPSICFIAFTLHHFFLVYRPLHSAWLRLLRHHQGNRPQTGHRPHQAARLHRGDLGKHRPWRKSALTAASAADRGLDLALDLMYFSWLCRNTRRQRTGCTRKPGVCFWSQTWSTVPLWSWSGASLMRTDSSSSCATKSSSGKKKKKEGRRTEGTACHAGVWPLGGTTVAYYDRFILIPFAARTGFVTAARRLWRADREALRVDWTRSSASPGVSHPNGR